MICYRCHIEISTWLSSSSARDSIEDDLIVVVNCCEHRSKLEAVALSDYSMLQSKLIVIDLNLAIEALALKTAQSNEVLGYGNISHEHRAYIVSGYECDVHI